MNRRVLVNDHLLYSRWTGVATYVGNVLQHWPTDVDIEPRGFVTHVLRKGTAWPNGDEGSTEGGAGEKPIAFGPLARVLDVAAKEVRVAPPRFSPDWWRGLARRLMPFRPVRRLLPWIFKRGLRYKASPRRFAAYWEPNYIAFPTKLPTVTSVCDLSVLEYPQWHPNERVQWWEQEWKGSMARTHRWIAISQFTADRMTQVLSIAPELIDVIPLAARAMPFPSPDELPASLASAGAPSEYFLVLGTIEPRKNLRVALDAWAALPPAFRNRYKLIFAGGPGWGGDSFWQELTTHPMSSQVMTTGYVSKRHAAVLLAGAAAALVPSHYEGFGLPVLEAMACGTPVICSDIPVFKEVAGEGACLVAKDDPQAWAQAMQRIAEDQAWTTSLGQAGTARNQQFSWNKAARLHAASIARTVKA
ncbi:MAG: glycosyltransferase family 1 protein [Phycisphaeraceae bacterium]